MPNEQFRRPSTFWIPSFLSGTSAWTTHIPFAFWCAENLRPSLFVELGTHKGDSFFAFCQAVKTLDLSARCYAVDTWTGDEHSGFYGEDIYQGVEGIQATHFASFATLLRSSFDDAANQFADGSIDLLHIDGRHRYEDIRHDFERWLPKLSRRAVVLIHDTEVRERGFGVWKFWNEISAAYPAFAFAHGHGLGVLGVGSELPDPIAALFKCPASEAEAIRDLFEFVGNHLSELENLGRPYGFTARENELWGKTLRDLAAYWSQLQQANADLQEAKSELEEKSAQLRKSLQVEAELNARIAQRNAELKKREAALQERDQQILVYEAERSTFGAQVGRWITRQRNRWAPPDSRTGWMVGLIVRAARKWHREGWAGLLRAGWRKLKRRRRAPEADLGSVFDPTAKVGTYWPVPGDSRVRPPGERNSGFFRVLIVSADARASSHSYRVENIAEALIGRGIECLWLPLSRLDAAAGSIGHFDVLVLQRADWQPAIEHAVHVARERGVPVVFDVDDWVFNPDLAQVRYLDGIRFYFRGNTQSVRQMMVRMRRTLDACDYCTVPTPYLAQRCREVGKPAIVLPNVIPAKRWRSAQRALGARKRNDGGTVRIVYASGTVTHQRDFKEAVPALARVMAEHPQTILTVVGRLALNEFPELEPVMNRVELRQLVLLNDLPAELARADINLAPVELGNPFCEGKSELKFVEAAIVELPTVASANSTFRDAIRHGETGMLAATEEEWYRALKTLVSDAGLRRKMGRAARDQALRVYTTEHLGELAVPFYRGVVAAALGEPGISMENGIPLAASRGGAWAARGTAVRRWWTRQQSRLSLALLPVAGIRSAIQAARRVSRLGLPGIRTALARPVLRLTHRKDARLGHLLVQSGLFDPDFYRAAYPDVAKGYWDPALHYVRAGWRERRNPHQLFDTGYYLDRYPDSAAGGQIPLLDFLESGWRAGRNPHPLFDTAYYLEHYPEVLAAGMNPLVHYLRFGAQQGCNPSAAFDTNFYIEQIGSISTQESGLGHYVRIGRASGFQPQPPELLLFHGEPPKFSVVAILYRKEEEIHHFLHGFFSQTYLGPVEIVLVDDQSPDRSTEAVRRFVEEARDNPVYERKPEVRIFANPRNLGNCLSRNRGIAEATGDLIVVIDADCMVNREFLRAHAAAFGYRDCDVTVGPMNLEAPLQGAREYAERYELNPAQALLDQNMQDPVNLNSFLNCVTRNLCIRRDYLETSDWFDPLFSYSADPASGYGWEDVEFGYRLYLRGARIRFVPTAISIHVSDHPYAAIPGNAVRSAKNFRRLFEKHPDLPSIARTWALTTHERIVAWLRGAGAESNDDTRFLEAKLREFIPYPFHLRKSERRLRVLTYRWHCAHQYEIYKLPHDFFLVQGTGTKMAEVWDYAVRPLRPNARLIPLDRVKFSDYDVALLHFDENVLNPEFCNGVVTPDWGAAFKFFSEQVPLPKVAICHGTPQFHGQYTPGYSEPDLLQVVDEQRQRLVDYTKNMLVIVNSHQAQREWGYRNSRVIWHGFDPAEFPLSTYRRGILTIMDAHLLYRPHYNGAKLHGEVMERLGGIAKSDHVKPLIPPGADVRVPNEFGLAKYQSYVDWLRAFSIYFNPTARSPMPRTRAESMLCGLAIVTANNHDADMFIRNGVNGFYGDTPEELASYLKFLLDRPDACRKMGQEGRRTATRVFNHDQFLYQWQEILLSLAR